MGSFLTACGATGPLTLEIEGPDGPGTGQLVVPRPFVLIGRDGRSDVLLDHDLVSRRHAYLQVIAGRPYVVDLESRSGTVLGEGPVESGWLGPDRAFTVGPYKIRVTGGVIADDPSPPQNPMQARWAESGELPKVAIEFESRTTGHSVWRMSQVLAVLGSSPRCKVRLYDSNVSKLHCALLRTASGLWMVDLFGRDGITVNGKPVRYSPLNEGDVLGLGQVTVRPKFDDRSPRPEASTWGGNISIGGSASTLPVWPPAWSHGSGPAPGQTPASRPGPTPVHNPPNGQAAPPATNPMPTAHTPAPVRTHALAPSPPPPLADRDQRHAPPPLPRPGPAQGVPGLNPNEPALAMLLNHFGQMQQQMNDQFQQSLMMMMQMFSGMHRDQMGLVREELDRLRELSAEIQTLKSQMAAPAPAPAPATQHFRPAPPPNHAALPPNWPSQGFGRPPQAPIPHLEGPNPNRPVPPRPGAWVKPGEGGPPLEKPPSPADPESPNPDHEVHDWLNDRLTVIQLEQRTRWQRLLGMLGKKS